MIHREGIDGVESDNDVPSPHAYLGSGEMIHREDIDGVESDNDVPSPHA